jgi:hypothetical protein
MYYLSTQDKAIDHLLGHFSDDGKSFVTCREDQIDLAKLGNYTKEKTDSVCSGHQLAKEPNPRPDR